MSFPSFSTGEVLTAADMNAVGLWLVKTVTIGAGVSSVPVADAFSADYNNYLILLSGGVGTGTDAARLTLGSTTTGYYYAGKARNYLGADLNIENNNVNGFWYAGETSTNGLTGQIMVFGPQTATRTQYSTVITSPRTDGYFLAAGGFLNNTTQYTGFTVTFNTQTQTGGTIRVYGYRN
jgi:hypothetical protein